MHLSQVTKEEQKQFVRAKNIHNIQYIMAGLLENLKQQHIWFEEHKHCTFTCNFNT